ncbi:MAG TPA: substrate-binding domain-containing protein [Terracidiphilus sp.]|nr:substrate-binding domain-containing protein [Terracidiphilus sp.]
MMKAIRAAIVALAAMGLAFTSGCDRHSNKEVYYLISVNTQMPYWQTLAAGFNKAAAQYKVTATVTGPANYDSQAELAELQKAVAAKPAGILIQAADAAVLQPGIDAAISAGVPVITVDSDAEGSKRLYFIGTNNLEAGRLGGQHLVTKLGGKGNVVIFVFAGQPNIEERLKGLKDVFSTHPDIKIVDVIDVKGDRNAAFDRTQQYMALTGPKKIDAFVSLESTSGKIISDAVSRAGGNDRTVLAWDVNQDTLDGIKSGVIGATVAQKPFTMGYVGLKALDEIFHNPPAQLNKDFSSDSFSPYPEFVDTGTSLVDKSNVDVYIAAAAGK